MAKIKLTKSAVDAAQPQTEAVELGDTLVPGFLCKITPAGRKVFMLQYRTNAGERRKPSLGLYGELTVEQARSLAQEWLAQVRRGGDPAAEKAVARQAPTVKELQPIRQCRGRLVSHRTVRPSGRLAATPVVRGQHRACPAAGRSCPTRCAARLPTDARSAAQASGRRVTAGGVHRGRDRSHRRRACGRRAADRPAGPPAAILAAVPPSCIWRTVPVERD
ncbi:MAG: hypothetical protein QOF74_5304 [Caballeronia mineralivorans]|jgi:hypothetical protein|nr:hypothetical protein [Caballeronia mineralivorans]